MKGTLTERIERIIKTENMNMKSHSSEARLPP